MGVPQWSSDSLHRVVTELQIWVLWRQKLEWVGSILEFCEACVCFAAEQGIVAMAFICGGRRCSPVVDVRWWITSKHCQSRVWWSARRGARCERQDRR